MQQSQFLGFPFTILSHAALKEPCGGGSGGSRSLNFRVRGSFLCNWSHSSQRVGHMALISFLCRSSHFLAPSLVKQSFLAGGLEQGGQKNQKVPERSQKGSSSGKQTFTAVMNQLVHPQGVQVWLWPQTGYRFP